MTAPGAPGVPGAVVGAVVQPPPPVTPAQVEAAITLASDKASEVGLKAQGQRDINRIWERTQQVIAISVVETTLVVTALVILAPLLKSILRGELTPADSATAIAAIAGMVLLSNLAGIVIGFYFGRTNHARTGGVGGGEALGDR